MDPEDDDGTRAVWKARIIINIQYGISNIVVAAVGLVIVFAAAPSPAGMMFGGALFAIFLVEGIYLLHRANRIRKMEPKAWFAGEPRPEDEPLAKIR
jgi:hypothetical protein